MNDKLTKLKIFDQQIEELQKQIAEIKTQKQKMIKELTTTQYHVTYRFLQDFDWSIWVGNQRVVIHIKKNDKIHRSFMYYENETFRPDFSSDLYEYDLATVEEVIFLQDLLDASIK